jgi:glutathione synthase/RimK-type ligase-like ATP-grasp enzyme
MQRIGILYGMENTFPTALVDRINSKNVKDVVAEHMKIGPVRMAEDCPYRVIVDRVSHDIEFYRAYLKNAALGGTVVINNPFWWSADDRFFNYALASKLGVAIPRTMILPHKNLPAGTTGQALRNLLFPLDWDAVFDYVGFPAFLKPFNGGGWKNLYHVHSREDFFRAYDESGVLCMMLQAQVKVEEYYRCYVVGQQEVRIMKYDPALPHDQRYAKDTTVSSKELEQCMTHDALKLCRALGYDLNSVEFAVEGGVPYAIDFLNPAPEAAEYYIGRENFEWLVESMANLAIERALAPAQLPDYKWAHFLTEKQTKTAAV